MSDTHNLKADVGSQPDGLGNRHEAARTLAEQAVRAQARGDDDEAERLFAQAGHIDPEAVANALEQMPAGPAADDAAPSGEEVAAMSRTVEPNSDAPPRSGVTGSGSGADAQGM